MSTPTYISFRAIVGKVIAIRRQERHLTQETLAKALNMTQANYSRIETGETNLTVEFLGVIAAQLGIAPSALIAQSEDLAETLRAQGQRIEAVKADDQWKHLPAVALTALLLTAMLNSNK